MVSGVKMPMAREDRKRRVGFVGRGIGDARGGDRVLALLRVEWREELKRRSGRGLLYLGAGWNEGGICHLWVGHEQVGKV